MRPAAKDIGSNQPSLGQAMGGATVQKGV